MSNYSKLECCHAMDCFRLSDLLLDFEAGEACTRRHLNSLRVDADSVTAIFFDRTGLSYIDEIHTVDNVCMADAEEVRSEYRMTFRAPDLVNYVLYCLDIDGIDFSSDPTNWQIPFPSSSEEFWHRVKLGSGL